MVLVVKNEWPDDFCCSSLRDSRRWHGAEYGVKRRQPQLGRSLPQIEAATAWVLPVGVTKFHYPRSGGLGRPRNGCDQMLRMCIAPQCLGLSVEGIDDARYDPRDIPRFDGVDLSREAVPNAVTMLKFGRLGEGYQLTQATSQTIYGHQAEQEPILPEGTIVVLA